MVAVVAVDAVVGGEKGLVSEQAKQSLGPSGICVCPKCDREMPHEPGIPCRQMRCSKCRTKMLRKGSQHHQAIISKRKKKQ